MCARPVQSIAHSFAGQWSQLPSKSKGGLTPFCLRPEFHCAYFPMNLLHWLLTSVTWGHKADVIQITWQYHYGFWATGKCSKLIKVLWAESTATIPSECFPRWCHAVTLKTSTSPMPAYCAQTAFLFLKFLYNFPSIFLSFSFPILCCTKKLPRAQSCCPFPVLKIWESRKYLLPLIHHLGFLSNCFLIYLF